jgi:DnaK suppressor protein
MDDTRRESLRQQIEDALDELWQEILKLRVSSQVVEPDKAVGRLSRMEAIQDRGVSEAALRVAEQRLGALRLAREHLDDPDFGYCIDCGKPIPEARIALMPEVQRCVRCAEAAGG